MSLESLESASREREVTHECALVGVALENPSQGIHYLISNGLTAQNHRGEAAAGEVYENGGILCVKKGMGLVSQVLTSEVIHGFSSARVAMGHGRYPTDGESNLDNIQPFLFPGFSIAHNGNVNFLERKYNDGHPTSDTFKVGKLISELKGDFIENATQVLQDLNGAYSFLFTTEDGQLFAARDPFGMRPLVYGKIEKADLRGMAIASETVGLSKILAQYEGEIPRGSLAEIHSDGVEVIWTDPRVLQHPSARCSFETSYFADAASKAFSYERETNHEVRKRLGARLYEKVKPDGDIVVPIPNSGWSLAEGIANVAGLPLTQAVHVSRFRGRNFTKPHTVEERKQDAFLKYNFIEGELKGKKVTFVDDSIVRGYTTQGLTLAALERGAEEIHWLIGTPIIKERCFWGIDFPELNELIYNQLVSGEVSKEEFEQKIVLWLVDGDTELAKKVKVSFQDLDDYIEITGNVAYGTEPMDSGSCYHCVTQKVPHGLIFDASKSKSTI